MDRLEHIAFNEKVKDVKGYVLVSVLALNFLPSVLLKRAIEEIEGEYDNITFYFVDNLKDSKLSRDLGVEGCPKMILFKDGEEIASYTGGASKTFIKDFILHYTTN